jgi:hypothetical protein
MRVMSESPLYLWWKEKEEGLMVEIKWLLDVGMDLYDYLI